MEQKGTNTVLAVPVRTNPSPTMKSAPIKTTLGSLNPAERLRTVRTPVSGSATSAISATTSMRGLLAIEQRHAHPEQAEDYEQLMIHARCIVLS